MLFRAPIAAELNRAALNAGSQTREGERDSERILRGPRNLTEREDLATNIAN